MTEKYYIKIIILAILVYLWSHIVKDLVLRTAGFCIPYFCEFQWKGEKSTPCSLLQKNHKDTFEPFLDWLE